MGPLDPDAWQTRWGVAPDGGFAAVYWHEADDEVRILRCKDATCTGSPEVVILGSVEPVSVEGEELGPYPVDLVFRPDGSPVVLMSGGESGAELSLYACKDQDCSDILTAPFDEGVRPTYGKLAVAPDGGLRVLYVDTETESLNLAVCADPVCEVIHSTMIVEQGIQIPSVPGIRIAPDGRTFIEYERDGASVQARVAVCNNPECSDGPTIFAFEDAMTPRTMLSDDGRFFIWYRSGPFMIPDGDMDPEAISDSFRLMIAECNATACQQAQPVDVGWQTLWAWGTREDLRLLGTPDGAFVVPQYWSPSSCDFLFEVAKVNLETRTVDIVMGPTVGMPDAAADTSNGEPVLLRVSDDGKVSMINLSEVAPSESGPMVSKCTTP